MAFSCGVLKSSQVAGGWLQAPWVPAILITDLQSPPRATGTRGVVECQSLFVLFWLAPTWQGVFSLQWLLAVTGRFWEERGAWRQVSPGKYSKKKGWCSRRGGCGSAPESSLYFVCKYEPASKLDCSEGRRNAESRKWRCWFIFLWTLFWGKKGCLMCF